MGRLLVREDALGRLDALARATAFSSARVGELIERYPGVRGLRQLRELLPLVDGRAASLEESWLRLLLVDDGLPPPTTQITVGADRRLIGILDMGWIVVRVIAEDRPDNVIARVRAALRGRGCPG